MALVNIGEIASFSFGFEPAGWASCDGRTLPIEQYEALYSVIGAVYGGDGVTDFALPDLNGRVVIGAGQGPNTSNYVTAERVGSDAVALTADHLPTHDHGPILVGITSDAGQWRATPSSTAYFGSSTPKFCYNSDIYADPSTYVPFASAMCGTAGGSAPHDNRQPALTLNFCIALYDMD